MGSLSKDLSGEVMGSDGLFITKDTLENRLKRGREETGKPGVSPGGRGERRRQTGMARDVMGGGQTWALS